MDWERYTGKKTPKRYPKTIKLPEEIFRDTVEGLPMKTSNVCDPPTACATHGRCWTHSTQFLCHCGNTPPIEIKGLAVCKNCGSLIPEKRR